MEKSLYIHADWDDEAQVFVATSDAVPGLATEAATHEELMDKLRTMIPELLSLNGHPNPSRVPFELLTRRFAVAA